MSRKAVIGLIRSSVLSGALFLAGGAIPFIGAIVMLFTPAPIIGYAVGRPGAIWRMTGAVALAAVGIVIAAGPDGLLAYAVSFGLATVLIGYMLERETRFELIVAITTAAVLIAGTAAALIATGSPHALMGDIRDGLNAGIARSQEIYKLLGLGAGIEPESRIVDTIVELCPAIVAIAIGCAVLLNLAVFWRWVGKNRLGYKLFGDLVRWSAPEWLIWPFIAAGFALFIPFEPVRIAALDGFLCIAAVYFCHGLAIVGFYLKMLSTPAPWRGVIYFVAAVQPVIAAIVVAAGVFDMWVDFRRLRPPREEAGTFSDLL